ncbi:hypothetical protein [Spiribacter onubensis]|uniref:Uncharacterized protein n=1 Tax=Spiribacter onubensis TaxID=3122420 RepID=A0ABV3S9W1_9GAMM
MDPIAAERRHRAFLATAQLRYAWQFRQRGCAGVDDPVAVDVPPGWYGPLERLFEQVEQVLPAAERGGFRWRRLRSRQGVLEVAYDGVRESVSPLVATARETAAVTCERCGRPGARREVAGSHAVSCRRYYLDRLLSRHPGGETGVRQWWATPQPGLGGRSPAAVVQNGAPPEVLIEQALRLAMPATPRLNGAHRQRLQGVWPVLSEAFGDGLRSLRLAEFDPARGPGATLIGLMAGEADSPAQAAAVNRLARNGFSDLRLRLVGQRDLARPARASDPWSCMLAVEASVTIPRHQPSLPPFAR